MMSEWLAAQQRENGSWERPGGYCGNHYDTGWAGLALMATGNPKYDPVIKKGGALHRLLRLPVLVGRPPGIRRYFPV